MRPEELKLWLNHFEYHAQRPRQLPATPGDILAPAERQRIAASIATFQLGEQSQGHTLLRSAQRFAEARRLPMLVRIVELFIREEQRHAALLRAFMEDQGIALKRRDWTDGVFRRLRRLAGFELYLHVLITAELIGTVYYRALATATGCQRLKLLCRALVADELVHVAFESQLLLALSAARPRWAQRLARLAHRFFLSVTAHIVWLTHRGVLRHCGYGARAFVRLCLAQYGFYLEPLEVPLASCSRQSGSAVSQAVSSASSSAASARSVPETNTG